MISYEKQLNLFLCLNFFYYLILDMIGNISGYNRGTIQENYLNMDFKEHIPHGQLNDKTERDIHLPFSKNEIDFFIKRNQSTIREIEGHTHTNNYKLQELTQKSPTITVFNDLYNFNPTHKEMSYYHPHDTDKLIHHPDDKPRFEKQFIYDVSIPDKIEARKKIEQYHKLPQHSFTLDRRRK